MPFTRRGFLSLLTAAAPGVAAAALLDPERLLWVPGQKTFFLPTNTRLTLDVITREGLRVLEAQLRLTSTVTRKYTEHFGAEVILTEEFNRAIAMDHRAHFVVGARRGGKATWVEQELREATKQGLTIHRPRLITTLQD